MNSIKSSFFFFFFALSTPLCLAGAQTLAGNETSNLIEQVCERTHSKQNCIESLQSNPDSKNATLPQLVIIALRLASANATETALFVKNSLANQTLEPAAEQGLQDCSEYYNDAIELIDDAVAALLVNDTNSARTWVMGAIVDIESCEASSKPLLTQRNAMFRQLCNNALAINRVFAEQKQ